MRNATPRSATPGRLLAPLVLAAAVAACADQPTAAPLEQRIPTTALQAFDCTATRQALTCAPSAPSTGAASGVVIGGQNEFLRMASSNAAYDTASETFSVDVTVQNLMNEAIGTPDGTVADPEGIQVFFFTGPNANGAGDVTVANADGTGFFTAANQPFYAYPEILSKDEVSAPKTWQFSMPTTVTSFSFSVLIETDVQYLLVINELMANPTNTTDTDREWVEIYNAGTRPVDLQNLVIADSAASGRRPFHVIASSVLVGPGAYATLGSSTNTAINGGAPIDYAYGAALVFANSLDAFKISRVYGSDTLTIDRTQYASAAISAQAGISRELRNPALDNANMDGSNWADAAVTAVYGDGGRGTPKAQNSTYTP